MITVQKIYLKYEDMNFYIETRNEKMLVVNIETGVWKVYNEDEIEIVENCFAEKTLERLKNDGLLEKTIQLPVIEGEEEFTLLILEMTKNCNLKCDYCFENAGIEKSEFMKMETAIRAFELFSEISTSNRIMVEFNGGEALLNFDTIKEVVPVIEEIAGQKNIKVSFTLQTNGTLINADMIDYMNEKNISLGISIDGEENYNQHRKYKNGERIDEDLERNFELLKDKGKNFSTISVISRQGQYESIVNLQRKLEHSECRANLLNTLGRGENYAMDIEKVQLLAEEFVDFARKIVFSKQKIYEGNLIYYLMGLVLYNPFMCYKTPCGSGKNQLYVDARGRIYACQESCYVCEGYLGSVDDNCTMLEQAIEDSEWIKCKAKYKEEEPCITCEWRMICHVCPAMAKKKSAACEFNKIVLPQLIWMFAEHGDCIMNYIQYK